MLSKGCQSSAYIAQRFSNAITFILFKFGIYILNYIDDLASAETKETAVRIFNVTRNFEEMWCRRNS